MPRDVPFKYLHLGDNISFDHSLLHSLQRHTMAESSPKTHSPLVTSPPGQKVLDTVFDVSFIVLATLEDISKIPACPPPLACAAGAAMDIYRVAQVSRLSRASVIMRLTVNIGRKTKSQRFQEARKGFLRACIRRY